MSREKLHVQAEGMVTSLCKNGSDRVVPIAMFLRSDSTERCKRCLALIDAKKITLTSEGEPYG